MSRWRKEPPTHQEWLAVNNHGCWWVKFLLIPETTELYEGKTITWPETWLTEIVSISVSYEKGMSLLNSKTAMLHATGTMGLKFDLDDKEKTKDMYWQPVIAPYNDVKDRRPDGC